MLSLYNKRTSGMTPDPLHQIFVELGGNFAETYQMKVSDNDVIVTCNDELAEPVIYLPPVATAAGNTYTITIRDNGVSVSVDNLGDSEDWGGPYILANSGDQIAFRSTGVKYVIIEDKSFYAEPEPPPIP